MLTHLLQLGCHVGAVHIVGVPYMVHTQVMPYQQIPLVRLPHARNKILCTIATLMSLCQGTVSVHET